MMRSSPQDAQGDKDWAKIIADSIERNLSRYLQGERNYLPFVEEMTEQDPDLYDPRNISDPDISAAWHFADTFFDAVADGFTEVEGIPVEEVIQLMTYIVQRLRQGQSIEEPRVLSYSDLSKPFWKWGNKNSKHN